MVGSWLNDLYLDDKHSHFLIVNEKDGGVSGQTKFRASLEKYIKTTFNKPPSILIVVNGGLGTLSFVKEYIDQVMFLFYIPISIFSRGFTVHNFRF